MRLTVSTVSPRVARDRGQRRTLGQQARRAEVPQRVRDEPVLGELERNDFGEIVRVVERVAADG